MLQLIYYTNIKFQTYQDIYVAQERHRIKRKSNESENIENKKMEQKRTRLAGPGQTPEPSKTDGESETYKRKPKINASAEKDEGISESNKIYFCYILITEDPAPNLIPAFKTNVESFSFYFNKDRKLDKGPKVEINSYSQVNLGQVSTLPHQKIKIYHLNL